MLWQLNRLTFPVYNLGPGTRVGIWVQGCSLQCKGCISPDTWKPDAGKKIAVLDLFNWVAFMEKSFDGVTISGGEPFQQYQQLIAFAKLIKLKTTLNIVCFTGYTLDELKAQFPDLLFLKYIDYLIDGRYDFSKPEKKLLRGSANQNIYKITSGKAQKVRDIYRSNKWSLSVGSKKIFMTGIPQDGEIEKIWNI